MGTEKTRAQKIKWMIKMKEKHPELAKDFIIRQFVLAFHSTKHTAAEIWDIVEGQKQLRLK